MSTDLRSQIHTYGAQLVDNQQPITDADIAELLGKVRQLPPIPLRVRSKPGLWVALAAGAAVLLLFGGLSLLFAASSLDTPPATTPPIVTSTSSPSATTDRPKEEGVSVVGAKTYQDLSDQSSIGWEWHETGFNSPAVRISRLSDGTYIAYSDGYNGIFEQSDGPTIYSKDISGPTGVTEEQFLDPVESLHTSTDGTTWIEVPLDRFEGFVTWSHVEIPGGAPYLYVSVHAVGADRDDPASWSTWATDDGQTWFEVLTDGEPTNTFYIEYAHIMEYAQLVNNVVAKDLSRSTGAVVSSDGGRSFSTLDISPFGATTSAVNVFPYDGVFRALAWGERVNVEPHVYTENPILWESSDGEHWTVVGTVSGLDPRPDGRALTWASNITISPLPSGSLILGGAEPRSATFDDDPAAYILESHDGGLTWNPDDNFPTTVEPDHEGLLSAPYSLHTIHDWVVLNTPEVTLATDGDTWIRIDGPTDTQTLPLALRGAITSSWNPQWIAVPKP